MALILFASLAAAQTLTIPFYGYDSQAIQASIVDIDTATTMSLACPGEECGLFPTQMLTIGPDTYKMYAEGDGATITQDCSSAVCKESAGGDEANFPGTSTTTYSGSEIEDMPVTVTAGGDKLGTTSSTTISSTTTSSNGAATLAGGLAVLLPFLVT